MKVIRINPIRDGRWQAFAECHSDATVFHTKAWLEALHRTYEYEPVTYAIQDAGRVVSGIPFCAVRSFITGRRLVSLPFSDHCQPLLACPGDLDQLLMTAQSDALTDRFKYVEIRPLQVKGIELSNTLATRDSVVVHKVDISRSEEELLRSFHLNIRRNIAKTDRGQLRYEIGRAHV